MVDAGLSERSLGWLRMLHRRTHRPDDSLGAGPSTLQAEDRSAATASVRSHQLDLVDSGFALGLMAHRTPAWTEPYVAILDRLVERETRRQHILHRLRSMVAAASADRYRWIARGSPATTQLGATGHDGRHRIPADSAMTRALSAMPESPAEARRRFDEGCAALGLDAEAGGSPASSRDYGAALVLAKEWGLTDRVRQVDAAVDAWLVPTWDAARGEFAWAPRGELLGWDGEMHALLAAGDAGGPGRWTALSAPMPRCAQVVDVDFPAVALTRAEWINGSLLLAIAPLRPDPNAWIEFRIVDVEPRLWWVNGIDGVLTDVRSNYVVVRAPRVVGTIEFTPSSY